MQVALLGPLEVRTDSGEQVPVAGARLRTLLIRLALDAGRVVTPRQLVDAIWGDDPPESATNALQALVSRLRRAVPALPLESGPAGYRLAIDPQWTDTARFEGLVRSGDPDELRCGLDLWRGPALADGADTPALRAAAARLTDLRLTALADLATAAPADAVTWLPDLEAAVREHPTRESLVAALMRTLWTDGRPADALTAYAQTRDRLAETLGADPSPQLRELHLTILRGGAVGPAPAPSAPAAAPRSNLRAAITSFVGRDREVARVRELVATARLTTLVGPGGAGKTRLALESARGLGPAGPDGVWFVALAPVTEPSEVAPTVLATLGLREQALIGSGRGRVASEPTDPTSRVVAALADKRALLVLDNCEHLVAAAADLADRLLGDCPHLRILATSREPLAITGETLWTVEPLASPPSTVDAATALTYPAIRLLADRGAAARPDFTVNESNVDDVVELCRSLDGMPLAIELAAARLRTMTPAQIAERLDDRFRLLTGGSRTALPRHQTLRAVVDWSWDLLDEDERTLLRRLAVFTGGADLAAVEAVCGLGPATFGRLTSLVDKSLVLPRGDRYDLLETIKAYGLDRLAEAEEGERVRLAHIDHFAELAGQAEPRLRGPDQLVWLRRLAADHENLHTAVRRAVALDDAARALRLTRRLGWYWWLHGHRAEGGDLAVQVLTLTGDAEPIDRALTLTFGALNRFADLRVVDESRQMLEDAVRYAADGADHPLLRLIRPLTRYFLAPTPEGRNANDALTSFATCFDDPDAWVRAAAHTFYAHARLNIGDDSEAEGHLRTGLAGFRAVGERWGISFTLAALAEAAIGRGDHPAAAGFLGEALRISEELGTNEDIAQLQAQYAQALLYAGDEAGADAMLVQAHRTADLVGLPESWAVVQFQSGEMARARGRWDEARAAYQAAIEQGDGWAGADQFVAGINASLAYMAIRTGAPDVARDHVRVALAAALRSDDLPAIRRTLVGVADVVRLLGDPDRAAILLGAAADTAGHPNRAFLGAEDIEAAVRDALGDARFAAAYDRGRATPVDQLGAASGLDLTGTAADGRPDPA